MYYRIYLGEIAKSWHYNTQNFEIIKYLAIAFTIDEDTQGQITPTEFTSLDQLSILEDLIPDWAYECLSNSDSSNKNKHNFFKTYRFMGTINNPEQLREYCRWENFWFDSSESPFDEKILDSINGDREAWPY